MKRFIIEKSKDEFYTSHSGAALIGLCMNRFTSLAPRLGAVSQMKKGSIGHADVVRSYIGLLCLGKSDFEAISGFRQDRFFRESLGLKEVPSEPTLRQRLEDHSEAFQPIVNFCTTEFLRKSAALLSALDTGHVPLDIDVFTMDNSGTKKEKVSRTYQGMDGFAPIAAYLAQEGWLLEIEHREGSQHSQKNFIPFLARVLHKALALTANPLLVRLDSAHDAWETRIELAARERVDYILKWNPRGTIRRFGIGAPSPRERSVNRDRASAWRSSASRTSTTGKTIQEPNRALSVAELSGSSSALSTRKDSICWSPISSSKAGGPL
jgi:hypothetical protein